ncbi:MAG: PBP1A family penicillin-binding protein [Anaerolineae bacterium]|nr:PBP1A family penicillin-binding protein [Anaerolineae bacterium]
MSQEPPFDQQPTQPYYEPPTVPTLPPDVYALPPEGQSPPGPPAWPPQHPRRSRGRWGCWRTGLLISAMAVVALLFAGGLFGLIMYNSLADELRSDMEMLESMQGVETFQTSRIYDRKGKLLYELIGEGRRIEVPFDRIPFAMHWAIIATEDDTFYENPGFDPPSIARAAWLWTTEGDIVSGGSTITQQLIRQIVFTYEERNEQTLRRKLKEAALAWVMTRQYTKDEILTLYLNEVYFGNLAYGIEAAANVYFGKSASELTISESAFLSGLVQSPVPYDPYTDFAAAKLRQRTVLDLMVKHGYLSSADADIAFNEPPTSMADLASPEVSLRAPHFTVAVRSALAQITDLDPEMVTQGGLEITTTLDLETQTLAEQIVGQRVAEVRDSANLHNAALVAINPNTGEVLAMVGSVDYNDETIDGNVNVILSPQQPGSSMKPLTYAAAFERGWLPSDVLWDVPIKFDTGAGAIYEPHNYDDRFHGPVRLRGALANSYNIPALLLLHDITVPALLDMAQRLGIQSLGMDASQYGLSLTLGGGELTPLELTSAYAAFANGGQRVTPYLISKVTDNRGKVLYEASSGVGERVLDQRISFLISSILSDNDARTPAMGANSDLKLDFPTAVKTGTTNDYRDNWTIGYTPHLVVGVWAGNTDNTPMAEGTSGLTGAAPIWHDFMAAFYNRPDMTEIIEDSRLPPLRSDFTPPDGMEQRPICLLSSLHDPQPAADGCPATGVEWFPTDSLVSSIEPTEVPTPTATPFLNPETGEPYPVLTSNLERGIKIIGVVSLDPGMQETYFPASLATPGAWSPVPAVPLYCMVSPENADLPQLSLQLFIEAPRDPTIAVWARNWAYANGIPIEPVDTCPPDLVAEVEVVIDDITGATYAISQPYRGQAVWGVLPIIGTVTFNPDLIMFYKLEIGEGETPTSYITLGQTHTEQVVDGQLEMLHADGLPPGKYVLRLVLVARADAGTLPPFEVPITILPGPPTTIPGY